MNGRVPAVPSWLRDSLVADPVRFVDIGARGGWQRKWRAYDEHVRFIGVEADSNECARLRSQARSNEKFIDRALFHSEGQVPLYHTEPPTRTSLYRPNEDAMRRIFAVDNATPVTRVEQVSVSTLDRVLAELGDVWIDFIKLDTQGCELDILRGAETTLAGTVIGIETEVEFMAMYEGQPLFPDVVKFLQQHSFEFIDFLTTYSTSKIRFQHRGSQGYGSVAALARNWSSLVGSRGGLRGGQRLVYGDALFLREPRSWIDAVASRGNAARSHALRGLLAVTVVGYYEYAAEISDLVVAREWITDEEHRAFSAFLNESLEMWPRLATDLARFGRRIAHRLRHLGTGDR